MKNLIYTGLFLALAALSSCTDDFLDTEPLDRASVDTYWTSEINAKAALSGVYESMYQVYGFEAQWGSELDAITPNAFDNDNRDGQSAIARGLNDPDNVLVNKTWRVAFEGIGRANILIENIDRVPMNEDLKERFKAEAVFMRAFYYHNLTKFFGDVPLILEAPNNNTQGQLPRTPKAEVVDAIINDLNMAASILPENYPSSEAGRATKGAALALKARVALYNERWPEAIDASREVVNSGVYSLFPDFRELFLEENEGNSEVIFDVQFVTPFFTNNYHNAFIGAGRVAVVQDLVDAFPMTDGEPIATSPLYDPANPFANRDPRLNQSIVTEGSNFNGQVVTGEESFLNTTGYCFKKYTYFVDDEERVAPPPTQAETNYIIIRYAEVLLTLAEAENEQNGPTTVAYDAINALRSRASVNMPEVAPGLSKEAFREVVRNERRIELAGEGLYYNDILRWRIAESVMNADALDSEGVVVETRVFDPARDYLWPIPTRDILLNPNLEQNPGY
jgi:hypothetical protein